jgi:hypothetical protein
VKNLGDNLDARTDDKWEGISDSYEKLSSFVEQLF